jgi:hypothetical protein
MAPKIPGVARIGAGSRTAVAERSGAKTQLTGAAPDHLDDRAGAGACSGTCLSPHCRRGISASLSLADIPGTVRLWRQRKAEFLLSIAAFLGSPCSACCLGSRSRSALSILNVFRRAWRSYDAHAAP